MRKQLTGRKALPTVVRIFQSGTDCRDVSAGCRSPRNLGVTAMKIRLTKALSIEETDKIRQWHDSIDATYAPVTIKIFKKLETVPELTIAMMPFLPDQQLALACSADDSR